MRFHMAPFLNWMKKSPKENVDYCFIDTKPFCSVKILRGKFKNVIYQYGKITFQEIGQIPVLKFDFEILEFGKHVKNSLSENKKFHKIIGDILTEIITNQAEKENPYAYVESDRTDYIEKFDL